jgi:hypothetical protein
MRTINQLSILFILILTGCVMVPASKIQIGPAYLRIPKNIEVQGLEVVINSESNFTVKATSIKSFNDPAVIDKTAAGEVAIMREFGSQLRQTGAAVAAEMMK